MGERVFVIIPVLNGWDETAQCLRQLEPGMESSFTVVVVDHGSTDETKTELPARFPKVVHLLETEDLWWTGATNAGIRFALEQGADYVIPLNNDCFLDAVSIHRLVAYAAEHAAIVAPVQRAADSSEIRAVTTRMALGLGFVTLRINTKIDPARGDLVPTDLVIGGRGAVISRNVLDRVGLFAEDDLPHYHADTDFFLRCARAGIPLLIAQDVDVFVDEKRTSLAAARYGETSWQDFRLSLTSPRSHRNLPALRAFFRRNYPIRALWPVGVLLYLSRTMVLWAAQRGWANLARRLR